MSTNNSKLIILGCGHSESVVHHNNNALVQSPEGNLLIDCGHTIKHALLDQSLTIENIDAIYISHVHGDHVFGLERVAYETKFKYNKKVDLFIHESILEELWDFTLKGSLGRHGDGEATIHDYFNLKIINNNVFCYAGIDYDLIKVKHTQNKSAHGLLINQKIFYSTDTIAIPEIIADLKFDVGFHDVTLTDWNPVHATLNSMIENYPKELRSKLYLMSYEDNWSNFSKTVKNNFLGFAYQGQVVEI